MILQLCPLHTGVRQRVCPLHTWLQPQEQCESTVEAVLMPARLSVPSWVAAEES